MTEGIEKTSKKNREDSLSLEVFGISGKRRQRKTHSLTMSFFTSYQTLLGFCIVDDQQYVRICVSDDYCEALVSHSHCIGG